MECDAGDVDTVSLDKLPDLLGEFYFSARKKKVCDDGTIPDTSKVKLKHYKNSSLKSGRAALNRYFKGRY